MQEKTLKQLEAEAQATIKLIMVEMETLASQPPAQACEPDAFNERRRRVVRKIWGLFKLALQAGQERGGDDGMR
jgi:hypothetical protein